MSEIGNRCFARHPIREMTVGGDSVWVLDDKRAKPHESAGQIAISYHPSHDSLGLLSPNRETLAEGKLHICRHCGGPFWVED